MVSTDERRSRFELKALLETSRLLIESQDPDFVLDNLLLIAMGKLLVSKGVVLLCNEPEMNYVVSRTKGSGLPKAGEAIPLRCRREELDTPFISVTNTTNPENTVWSPDPNGILINLRTGNYHLGLLYLGPKFNKKEFELHELEFLESLAIISSVAISNSTMFDELKSINRKLDRKVHDLHTLLEMSQDFNSMVSKGEIINSFKFAMLGQLLVRKFFLIIDYKGTKSLEGSSGLRSLPNSEIMNIIFELPEVYEVKNSENPLPYFLENNIDVVISLHFQNQQFAVVGVGERANGATFEESDIQFLQSLGNLALLSIQKTLLLEERMENIRMQEELETAREIQLGLLPAQLPKPAGLQLAALNVSSKQVGGDYYDFVQTPDGGYLCAIADVTGKGIPAALLMANLQSMIHALAPFDITIADATSRINQIIFDNTPSDKFITFFWGKFSSSSKHFTYVNAGHNPPYLFRGIDEILELSSGGLMLGAFNLDIPYDVGEMELESGDVLVFFTDGVTEAMNPGETEEFGEKRLIDCIRKNIKKSGAGILESLRNEVQEFSGEHQSDDITAIVVKVD